MASRGISGQLLNCTKQKLNELFLILSKFRKLNLYKQDLLQSSVFISFVQHSVCVIFHAFGNMTMYTVPTTE